MKPVWRGWVLGGLAGACALVSGAHGQEVSPEERAQKEAVAESIVAGEELAAGRAFDAEFRTQVGRGLASLPLLALEAQQGQRAGLGANLLGGTQADLVYTPVAPCRIVDTRLAGGVLAGGTTRDFLVAATDYSGQGGSTTTCGVPSGPATAAVINFVAVAPTGQGSLRAWPFGQPEPLTSIINYTAGVNIANGLVVSLCDPATATCTSDLTVRANINATHLVADVLGYFQRFRKEQVKSFVVTKRLASDVFIGFPCSSYTSIVVDAPVAGTVLVRATLQLVVGTHNAGANDYVYANLATSATNCDPALADLGFTQMTWVSGALPSGLYYPVANLAKSFPVSAGINTFYVNGSLVSGTSNQRFYHVGMDATFVPN